MGGYPCSLPETQGNIPDSCCLSKKRDLGREKGREKVTIFGDSYMPELHRCISMNPRDPGWGGGGGGLCINSCSW